MALADGQVFAGYTIVRHLGSGGMGDIYLAQHPRLPRRDVLKVLPIEVTNDSEYRERFNREADIAASLWHPHIVTIHDRGEFDGQLWISMDFVDGTDAARLLQERYPNGMPPDEVIRIVTAVADALDYAHQRQLLHRDVKPSNILLAQPDSGHERVMLADFGIARWVDDASGLTATNMTVGTVAYAAPEQLMGKDIDGKADQYALAATAFHLLTGSPLFQNSNPAVVISQHLSSAPPAIGSRRPELSELGPVFSKALAKAPAERYDRCLDFAHALEHRIGTPADELGATQSTVASPVTAGPRHHKSASRVRPGIAVAVVLAVLLIAASAVAVLLFRQDNHHARAAAPKPSAAPPPAPSLTAPPPQPTPVLPVVAIGAQCATLGAAGVTQTGVPAYCSHLASTGAIIWSLYPGDVSSPTVTPDPTDQMFPPQLETPLGVCMEQTHQSRFQCLQDIRRSNATGLPTP
ncbi:MAG: serine/threonine protein kinase [Mycobacterium sp.]|jgi:serine/threonine-protein kinase|nr:serine/threonine protein kinase [Mycobacterium sp.]